MEHLKFQFERRKGQIKLEMEGLLLTLTYAADTAEGLKEKLLMNGTQKHLSFHLSFNYEVHKDSSMPFWLECQV